MALTDDVIWGDYIADVTETKNYSVLQVEGTTYTDVVTSRVNATIGDANASSYFRATLDNFNGEYTDTFNINDEVIIHSTNVNPYQYEDFPEVWDNRIFLGIIEDIDTEEDTKGREQIVIRGRDYTARMQDITVEPVVYNNTEISAIIIDLMTTYLPDISTASVRTTSVTLAHFPINQRYLFDVFQELAELAGFYFYIDVQKVLHFEEKGYTSSGITLNNTNVIHSNVRQTDRELFNQVWVYGDRVLTRWKNTFTAAAGSVYQLDYRPHNTEVLVNGSIYGGGIYELVSFAPSGVQYLVDYDQQNIIFSSGTYCGDNIPGGGDSIVVNYDKQTPIIKLAENQESINAYGKRSKVIIDKNIVSPQYAKAKALNFLADNSALKKIIRTKLKGISKLTPGNTVGVNLPKQGVDNQVYNVLEVVYSFSKVENLRYENITVTISKRLADVTDTIKQLLLELRKLQAQDILDTDVITRLMTTAGSAGLRVNTWQVSTQDINNSFIVGHPVNSIIGSFTGNPVIGDQRSAQVVQVTGGDV